MSNESAKEERQRSDLIRLLQWALMFGGLGLAAAGLWAYSHYSASVDGSSTGGAVPQIVAKASNAGRAWFDNVAEAAGIDFRQISGQGSTLYMPEIMAGGVCLLDYDRDGDLDVYFVQAGSIIGANEFAPGNKMYRNRGDGSFEDVTQAAGVGDTGYGMGCTCGDFNNDGWSDLYVTNVGPNVLFVNNRDGTFTDVTGHSGVDDPGFSASAAFLDYDNDGDLDLFVTNYVRWSPEMELQCRAPSGLLDYCKPTNYGAPASDTLYHNNGDGTFTDVTETAGISAMFGYGLGVVCADFDDNGWTDICVANDKTANQLWMNQGDGTFRDEALQGGVAYSGDGSAEAGMGIDARDADGDGDLDLFLTHFAGETNTLYIQQSGIWEDRTVRFGLVASRPFTGFGTAMVDLNNDGFLDIYVANGRVAIGHAPYAKNDPYAEPNQLFAANERYVFHEVMPRGGTDELLIDASRGAAFGDYDNDGDLDIFVVNRDAQAYLLRNRAGGDNHWIVFDVTNVYGGTAIGARVRIEINGASRIRDVRSAYSYCAGNDPRVHFGLGKTNRIDSVSVRWPDGTTESFGPVASDRVLRLRRRK